MSNFVFKGGKILQIKIADVDLPGLPETIAYKQYDGDLNKLCAHIISVIGNKPKPDLSVINPNIIKIMETCFRRAIFTSMDSEINSDSMFNSIRNCIAELNMTLPTIQDGHLSQYVKGIILDLDSIDRYSGKGIGYTCLFSKVDKGEIDSLKIKIIDKLHFLNYHYDLGIDLPNDIGLDYELNQVHFKSN
jgi:hypothetical protein